jgi:hypothetical protein
MSHTGIDQTDEEILCDEVSDDALEAAGGLGREQASPNTHPFAIICIPFAPPRARQTGIAEASRSGE